MRRGARMRSLGILVAMTAWLTATPFAFASANVSCVIDDKNLKFMLEAIAGRSGPIVQVSEASLRLKAAAAKPIAITREHIVQQWIAGDDFRLQIAIEGKNPDADSFDLVILGRLDRTGEKYSDKYAGSYELKISGRKGERELKGRIVKCEIG
jgi:hypothetical protein